MRAQKTHCPHSMYSISKGKNTNGTYTAMKRSVSPQTAPEPNSKRQKFLGTGFFSSLKRVFSRAEPTHDTVASDSGNQIQNIGLDVLPADFTSRKRRMSVQEDLKLRSSAVPRSSSIVGLDGYQALTNSLQSERQLIGGAMEQRRASIVDAEKGVWRNSADGFGKDISPALSFPRNLVLPTNALDWEDEKNDGPVVVEHEFAPLYQDEEGNLVRPPFINLDPRERYKLLQMKKTMEASEFLQKRLQSMVDPDESSSFMRPDNKVDCSTQTHNQDYLERRLQFTNTQASRTFRRRHPNRRHKSRGMFSGEFYYEPQKKDVEHKGETQLTGYLGTLSNPKFEKQLEEKIDTKGFPDDNSSERLIKRRRSVGQRAGLDETIRLGVSQDLSLDKDYVEKTASISNIIKLKEQPVLAKKTSIGPSAGFNFDVDLGAIKSILQKRKEDDELIKESSTGHSAQEKKTETAPSLPSISFSSEPKEKRKRSLEEEPKPAFSFGSKLGTEILGDSKSSEASKAPLPAFSFGAKSTSETPTPALSLDSNKPGLFSSNTEKSLGFSFGNSSSTGAKSDAPVISFGAKKTGDDTKDTSLPKFSFGSTSAPKLFGDQAKESSTPKISFGDGSKASSTTKFSFGDQSKESSTPKISFGGEAKESTTPKFSFGGSSQKADAESNDAPKFSFGESKPNEQKDSSKVPAFSFEKKAATEAPKFSFEKKENTEPPSFAFGNNDKKEAPKFSFGQSERNASEPPKFSFGQKTETTKPAANELAPKFLFGNEKSDKPLFGFGGAGEKTSTSLAPTTKENTPAFSFSSKETTPKPAATPGLALGNSAPTTTAPSFSGNAQPTNSGFSFGQTALVDPAQIFGGGNNAPQPAFNFNVSKESTPFKFGAPAPPKSDGFNFSNNVTSTFGASRSATPSAGFGFGSNNNGNIAAPAPQLGTFGANPNPGFGSTPAGGNTFGQTSATPGFGGSGPANGGFSFSANALGSATGFNSAPGSFGLASRENTPPVNFGQPGSAPGQPFTPPLAMQGRKIAQMRPRKRF